VKDTRPVILIFQNPAPEILEWAQNLKSELGVFEKRSAPSVFWGGNAAEYACGCGYNSNAKKF